MLVAASRGATRPTGPAPSSTSRSAASENGPQATANLLRNQDWADWLTEFVRARNRAAHAEPLPLAEYRSHRDVIKDSEWVPSFCVNCQAHYCNAHWVKKVYFDEIFYDYTDGICPEGHTKQLDD